MIGKLEISLIKGYQKVSHPIYKKLNKLNINVGCRYIPSCSEYSIEAIKKYGPKKGTSMSIKRIMRCNPNYPAGYDPVE